MYIIVVAQIFGRSYWKTAIDIYCWTLKFTDTTGDETCERQLIYTIEIGTYHWVKKNHSFFQKMTSYLPYQQVAWVDYYRFQQIIGI